MGFDKEAASPLARFLGFSLFGLDEGAGKSGSSSTASGSPSPSTVASVADSANLWAEQGFEYADDLEKGLADDELVVSPRSHHLMQPLLAQQPWQRCTILLQEGTGEYHLVSDSLDLLVVARPALRDGQAVVEFYLKSLGKDDRDILEQSPRSLDRRRPSFVMTHMELTDEWTMMQPRCECCIHRPHHRRCEFLGKGQQVVRIKHSRKKIHNSLVHCADVVIPPLVNGHESLTWCPAVQGKDLGDRSPQSPTRLQSSTGAVEPVLLSSKMPVWDEDLESLVLSFKDCPNLTSSPRNFMLCGGVGEEKRKVLQHAQVGPTTWCLDFQHPLSRLQAFGVAMSTLQWD